MLSNQAWRPHNPEGPKIPIHRGVLSPNFRLSAYYLRHGGLFSVTIPRKETLHKFERDETRALFL